MTTSKLVDNKRRNHAEKVLIQASKKHQEHVEAVADEATDSVAEETTPSALREQYDIIREDVLKLRNDLGTGYDLVKDWIADKSSLKNLMSTFIVSKKS